MVHTTLNRCLDEPKMNTHKKKVQSIVFVETVRMAKHMQYAYFVHLLKYKFISIAYADDKRFAKILIVCCLLLVNAIVNCYIGETTKDKQKQKKTNIFHEFTVISQNGEETLGQKLLKFICENVRRQLTRIVMPEDESFDVTTNCRLFYECGLSSN